MIPSTDKLSTIFDAAVTAAEPLFTDGKTGLKIKLGVPTDLNLGHAFLWRRRLDVYSNEMVFDLVSEFGVVVTQGCSINCRTNTTLSKSLQDPFHIDNPHRGVDYITALTCYPSKGRDVPTTYTTYAAFRTALATLATEDFGDPEINEYLQSMCHPDRTYSLTGEDGRLRRYIQVKLPQFTQMIADRISPDQKYVHNWNNGIQTTVFHSNKPRFILHGRTESIKNKDFLHNLIGYDIERSKVGFLTKILGA